MGEPTRSVQDRRYFDDYDYKVVVDSLLFTPTRAFKEGHEFEHWNAANNIFAAHLISGGRKAASYS